MAQARSIRKKTLGSYPHTMVVFSITLALLVVGLFGTLLISGYKISNLVKESIEMQVYLERGLPETQLLRLQQDFASKPYIAYKGSQPQVRFLSKEEGAKELIDQTGEDFQQFLGDNPLRDAYILRINAEYADSVQLGRIVQELKKQDGVFEVQYVQSLIDSINQNLRRFTLVLLGFAVVLTVVVVILINNTIKLALFSQRFLIRSMQLVGATPAFIQWPFLRRATWQGVASGVLSGLLLWGLLQYAALNVPEIQLFLDQRLLLVLFVVMVALGAGIGFFSSYRAVKKYLRLSLDDLY
ncbi:MULTISPECIES: cell division protein FtsX [Hymenobacter]|uniref:Cell division protein FtsX n=2 Tax=Hymenobacter TaxID=89966 RepID=A0ABS6X2E9_9BACT|nr:MULTISPECIES: permease-like cell division protein FtsX [Hymenobacter]MBO3272447.1 permease-like cell division protein FtsX [Hymenobacter defluvii]MBW3129164.1 permease-like cell division protein FtsX [Hymenobacter profundi]QNE40316.1 FtsX-like permease family protein [Hymenobacter sp. NBH84]